MNRQVTLSYTFFFFFNECALLGCCWELVLALVFGLTCRYIPDKQNYVMLNQRQ